MPFIDGKAPKKVSKLKPVWIDGDYVLFWDAPKYKDEMNRAVRYVVYQFFRGEKIDLGDASKIVAITSNNFYKLPYEHGVKQCVYVVTALDRMSNESKAAKKKVRL